MRVVPIKEVLAMSAGETVPSVRGQITAITDQMSGGAGEKAWRFQKLSVKDETGEIKVKVWDRDPIPKTVLGAAVCLSCKEGEKGMTGIKVKEDEYRGVKSLILNITGTGIIDIGQDAPQNGQQQQAPPAAAPTQQSAPAAQQSAPRTAPTAAAQTNAHQTDEPEVKRTLNRLANLYLHCLTAAEYVQHQWETSGGNRVMSQEKYEACVGSLFIEANRKGLACLTPGGEFNKK